MLTFTEGVFDRKKKLQEVEYTVPECRLLIGSAGFDKFGQEQPLDRQRDGE